MGVPTRGDKKAHVAKKRPAGVWSDKMVRNILKNETYLGTWFYGKTHMISDGLEGTRKQKPKCGLGKQVPRPREEWVAVEVPAIISQEDFLLAQERLKLNIQLAKRNTKGEYLMARRLRCRTCGYTFIGMTRREKNQYYRCNGAWHTPKVCDTPHFRVADVDNAVWEWLKSVLENPDEIANGLDEMQEDSIRANQGLMDRLTMVEERIADTERQLAKLLDLYLTNGFPQEVLLERKNRLEESLYNLRQEKADLSFHLQATILTEKQKQKIREFCSQVRNRVDYTTFEQKRELIDILDVRGTLAIENDEKVVYIGCKVGKPRVSVVRTSHSSNTGETSMTGCGWRPTVQSR